MSASPPVNMLGLTSVFSPPSPGLSGSHGAQETLRGRSRERRALLRPREVPSHESSMAPAVAEKTVSPLASPHLRALRRPSLTAARAIGLSNSPPIARSGAAAATFSSLGDRRISEDRSHITGSPPSNFASSPAKNSEAERPESPFFGEMSPFGSRSPSLTGQERPSTATREDILLAHRFLRVRVKVKNHPEWNIRVPPANRKLHLLEIFLSPTQFEVVEAPPEVRQFYEELSGHAHQAWLTTRERLSILLFCADNVVDRGGQVAADWLFLQARDLLENLASLQGGARDEHVF